MNTSAPTSLITPPARRSFLKTLLVGAATSLVKAHPWQGLVSAHVQAAPAAGADPTPFLRLRPADFAPLQQLFGVVRLGFSALNLLSPLPPILVVRDGETYRALSAECTHAGCLLPGFDNRKIATCPCHNSRFNADGSVIFGSPAEFPLVSYPVTVESDGSLRIALPDFPAVSLTVEPLTRGRRLPIHFLAIRNLTYEVLLRNGHDAPWEPVPFALTEITPANQHTLLGLGLPVTVYLETNRPGAWITVATRLQPV